MRLICGFYHLDGKLAETSLIETMIAHLNLSRLAPATMSWINGSVALAALDYTQRDGRRFALEADKDSDKGYVLALDSRLDEKADLEQALKLDSGCSDETLFDSLLTQNGPAALEKILGDFAFAAWHKKTARLICARDIFGIRPLAYIYRPGELFAFASLPHALGGSGLASRQSDLMAVARHLVRNRRPDEYLVTEIKRLLPAHFLEVSPAGLTLTPYWQLDPKKIGTNRCTPQQAAQQLRQRVDQAIMCRLPQQGEAGAHLSGGLDSSSIAVLAARALCAKGRKLHSYSFLDRQRNDITLEDETDFVNAVLAQEDNITSTPIRPPHRSFEIQNDLYISSSLAADDPENSVCAHAESQDVHLILSGWGGDEAATFNGRGAMAELLIRGRIGTLARELRGLMRERNWSLRQVVYQEVTSYFIPDWLVDFKRRLTGKELSTRGSFRMAFSPLMRKRLRAEPGANISIGPDGRKNRYELMTSPHIAFRAEDWALRGARHGLAFAFPLLDRRVVEYALSLPSEMFIHGGFRRRPFREAMCDVLPDKLRLRHEKYQPFPGNAIDVAERRDEAMALLEKLEGNEDMRRLFDLKRLRRQLENFPSPEELRAGMVEGENPTPLPVMTAAMHTLHTASIFLNRMAGDDNRPPAPVQNS